MLTELMNETEDPRDAVVTMTYEYIEGSPQDFYKLTPVWLDIDSCGNSERPAFPNTTFNYTMDPPWTANFSGKLVALGGHLHDGGTHLDITKNNVTVCDSVATYGGSAGYVETSMPAGMTMNASMGMDMVHISSMSGCTNDGMVNVGDEWSVTAFYNTSEYAPMQNSDGTLAEIMGISLMYVAVNDTSSGNGTATGTSTATASSTSSSTTSSSSTSDATAVSGSRARCLLTAMLTVMFLSLSHVAW